MPSATAALLAKLDSIGTLTDNHRQAIAEMPIKLAPLAKGEDAVEDGQIMLYSCVVVEGMVHREKTLGDGSRQILSFHPAGDIPDLPSLHLKKVDYSLTATINSTVGFIKHEDLRTLFAKEPALTDLFWRDTLIDAARFLTWMLMIGQASSAMRMAHLFCEMSVRTKLMTEDDGSSFRFPVTQSELADALGMSVVHANRTLQDLRGAGLLAFEGGNATILNWTKLVELGQFDSGYLHQDIGTKIGALV